MSLSLAASLSAQVGLHTFFLRREANSQLPFHPLQSRGVSDFFLGPFTPLGDHGGRSLDRWSFSCIGWRDVMSGLGTVSLRTGLGLMVFQTKGVETMRIKTLMSCLVATAVMIGGIGCDGGRVGDGTGAGSGTGPSTGGGMERPGAGVNTGGDGTGIGTGAGTGGTDAGVGHTGAGPGDYGTGTGTTGTGAGTGGTITDP
jgi:hypothetical protein